MSSFTHSVTMSVPFARLVAIAALMGCTMLASPPTMARAQTAPDAVIQLVQADTSRARGSHRVKGGRPSSSGSELFRGR
jgi:hypothetical protein